MHTAPAPAPPRPEPHLAEVVALAPPARSVDVTADGDPSGSSIDTPTAVPSLASILALHPSAASARHGGDRDSDHTADPAPTHASTGRDGEEGSLLTEYGLLIVVAATVAGVLIQWAGGSQITGLFNALLRAARETVGA